mmetsp:Transcript_30680/g.61415  ORF Transcript_30680/g.61415 Transcript_30680/m.61415 type:complete len:337 (+) Transcript_30680:49-1059(+)
MMSLFLAFAVSVPTTAWVFPEKRAGVRTKTVSMAVVPPGGKVLCVGNGPVLCLAAKRAALSGYDTYIVSGASTDTYTELLYEPGAEPLPNLRLLESITGSEEEYFDKLINECDAILVAIDGDDAISDGLLDVVMPATSTSSVKRVVAMSRHLNGKGMGPFVSASKGAANREVWAGGAAVVKEYTRMEGKVKALCERSGADFVVVRAGTLKGGGRGSDDGGEGGSAAPETARLGLASAFYGMGQQDIVNWRLLFDASCQGVVLSKGDVVEGPGFGGVFAATSAKPGTKGDSSRHGVAGAMAYALGNGPGNVDFGVSTAESRSPPTDMEWALEFSKLN